MDLSSIFTVAAYGVGGVATLAWASSMVYTVEQKTEALLTRFGKHFHTEKNAGIHVKAPWPLATVSQRVPTTLQQVKEELETKTKDDLFVKLPISIQFEVTDTGKFHFNNSSPVDQVKTIVSAAVRKYTSGKVFQELYDERDEISEEVIKEVAKQIEDYGVVLRRIVIDEPKAPDQVQDAFNKVRASERLVQAATNEAEAEKVKTVKAAEADRDRDLLRGEGAAGYRQKIFAQYGEQIKELVASGVDREEAVTVMMRTMELDTQREVAGHGNMVLYSTSNGNGSKNDPAALIATLKSIGVEIPEIGVKPAQRKGPQAPSVG